MYFLCNRIKEIWTFSIKIRIKLSVYVQSPMQRDEESAAEDKRVFKVGT